MQIVHSLMLYNESDMNYNKSERWDIMPINEKKAATNAAHIAKLDMIRIQPYKEEGERIRAAAAAAGKSLQGYILEAVREKMDKQK